MDKNFVYTCVECRLSDTIYKDTAQCKQGKFSDQLIVNRTQTALEVGSYQYHFANSNACQDYLSLACVTASSDGREVAEHHFRRFWSVSENARNS